MSPGDLVDIAGIFLPKPATGFAAMRAGLTSITYLEAQHIKQCAEYYSHCFII